MKIWSNSFKHESFIPPKYTCDGPNVSPHLAWDEVPGGTKSFALIFDDPDAPMGIWVHWLVCNIPLNVREIKENSVPGKQVKNDFRNVNYGGPCPPSGTHRYFFKLYALNVESLETDNKKDFYEKVEKYSIAKAVLMGKYKRK